MVGQKIELLNEHGDHALSTSQQQETALDVVIALLNFASRSIDFFRFERASGLCIELCNNTH